MRKKRQRNKTGILVAIIYCFIMYFILNIYGESIDDINKSIRYIIMPFGVVIIIVIFDFLIKKDFFDKKKDKASSH
ncbi:MULTISPECIES: hypothetical protein [Mammaliicoccus]|uniref:Uncharacterized protein n=3 Tax=Mammaliicoccus sciuri TaxID=1296 RepID=A0AAJ4SHW4_MAMSC|nr:MULTISPECIES: hypothetical protein [Mammaliicoccus]MCD8835266.1 hypothetical protein [Mammaliicoccus sciuri]MCJ0914178.1 hypothetical protein [Mammaliicoccus sciuri]MCJ0939782.1 hypothetical protein [Mammaliicoccus sciuri]MCJ0941766.1 hypothetical protein [Mammaliicoccus sciuri]MCJ0964923.1 hypothetical protein [Mammaliicoccus sciuri]